MKPRFLGAVYSLGLLVSAPSFAENALDESQIKQLFSKELRNYQPQNVHFQLGEFGAGQAIVALENAQERATGKELWLLEYDKQWKIGRKLADKVAEFKTVSFEKDAKPALFYTRSISPTKGVQQTEFKVISLQQTRELFSQTALDNTGVAGLMNTQFQEHRIEFEDVDKDGSLELIDNEIKIAYLGNQQSDSSEKKSIYKMQQGRLQIFDPNAPVTIQAAEKSVNTPPAPKTSSISLATEPKPLPAKPVAVVGDSRIAIGAGVRVRMQPKASAKEVTRLQFGTVVREVEKAKQSEFLGDKRDYWYKVEVADGKQGWVFGSFITPVDALHLPEKYIELAKTQLANDALQFSDWVDVVNFLNRVSSEVANKNLAAELAALRQQGLARSLKAIPAGQDQQSPYKEWLSEQANFISYHAPSGTWRLK